MKRIKLEQKTILKAVFACFTVSVLLLSSYIVIAQSLTDGAYKGYFANVNDDDKDVKTSIIITSIDASDIKIILYNRDGSLRHETDWISFGQYEKKFFRVWDLIGDSQYFFGSAVIKSNEPFTAMLRTFLSGSQVGKQLLETQITPVLSLDNIISQLSQLSTKFDELEVTTDNIETEIDDIEANQYVPFKANLTGVHTLDTLGGSIFGDEDSIFIESSSTTGDFIVTSVAVSILGIDDPGDWLKVDWIRVDFGPSFAFTDEDLTGDRIGGIGIELLPCPIAASSTGDRDMEIRVESSAGSGFDLWIPDGHLIVTGWKQAGDTITVTFDELS